MLCNLISHIEYLLTKFPILLNMLIIKQYINS